MRLALSILLLACASMPAVAAPAMKPDSTRAAPQPPATPRHAASSTLHGVTVNDPYRWLENPEDPAVLAWIKAQNAYTDQVLAAMPDGKAMNARVQQLAITSTTRSSPMLAGDTLFYMQETPPQPQPQLIAQPWPDGQPRVLVDLNANGGNTAIVA